MQSIILVALKSKIIPSFVSDNVELNNYLKNLWTSKIADDLPILTDDFAPVEFYINEII